MLKNLENCPRRQSGILKDFKGSEDSHFSFSCESLIRLQQGQFHHWKAVRGRDVDLEAERKDLGWEEMAYRGPLPCALFWSK